MKKIDGDDLITIVYIVYMAPVLITALIMEGLSK